VALREGERVDARLEQSGVARSIGARHGALLEPGVNTLALAQGHYFFKTLSDAHLHVVRGGVDATPSAYSKTDPPEAANPVPNAKGDEAPGELPQLTIA